MLHAHPARLSIEFEEKLGGPLVRHLGAALQAHNQGLAGVDGDTDLFVLGQAVEEAGGGQRADIAVKLLVLDKIAIDLGVHQMAGEVGIAELDAKNGLRFRSLGFEIHRWQKGTGPLSEGGLAAQNLGLQCGRPALGRQAQFTAKQLHHRLGEVHRVFGVGHLRGREALGDHEQGQVAHHLGTGRDFHNIAEQAVDVGIGLRNLAPARFQPHAARLLTQIGVLPARHFVAIDIGGAAADIRLERCVKTPHAFPVIAELLHGGEVEFRVARVAGQSGGNAAEIGLAGEPAHGIEGAVHRITACIHGGEHAGGGNAAGVVGVEVDGQANLLLQGPHQLGGGARLADAGHILDAENVCAVLLQRLRHFQVIGQIELGPRGVEEIAGVADRALADRAGLDHGIHRHPHIVDGIQRVEDAENIDAFLGRLLHEIAHDVVGVIGVAHRIGRAQQHLEGDVGDGRAQLAQALPGVFLQEAQGHVEGGATPAFQREQTRQQARVMRGDGQHVGRAHAGGKQALVGVAHGGVGEQYLRLGLEPAGKALGTEGFELVAQACRHQQGEIGGG